MSEYEIQHEQDGQEELPALTISEAEVERAVKTLCNRTAAGICSIHPELLKYGGAYRIREKASMFNVFLEEERVPDELKKAIIGPLFRNKGNRLDYRNYRGIRLISVPSKTFMRVLLNKIKPQLEEKLREEQAGFRGGRSTLGKYFSYEKLWRSDGSTHYRYISPSLT